MKIDYVFLGSNNDKYYLDFWPIISKTWKIELGIEPILGYVSNEEYQLENKYGQIKKFPIIEGVDPGLQSQIVRIFLAKFFKGNCLISDIDMLPISKNYFYNLSRLINSENFLISSADHIQSLQNEMFPMCYLLGHSTAYKEIFDLNLDWENFCLLLDSYKEGWFSDQKYVYKKIKEFNSKNKNCIFLYRGWDKYGRAARRIDRDFWSYDIEKIKNDYYIDCHLLRPYKENQKQINLLLESLGFAKSHNDFKA